MGVIPSSGALEKIINVLRPRDQGKGSPTGTSQTCPGWPCGGFIPGAVVPPLVDPGVTMVGGGIMVEPPFMLLGSMVMLFIPSPVPPPEPSNGSPTPISHTWPGSPCGGFNPAPPVLVVIPGCGAGVLAGELVVVEEGGTALPAPPPSEFWQALKPRTRRAGRKILIMEVELGSSYWKCREWPLNARK